MIKVEFQKSWIKLIFVTLFTSFFICLLTIGIIIEESDKKWFLLIIICWLFVQFFRALRSAILSTYISLNANYIDYCGKKILWPDIKHISVYKISELISFSYAIYIEYGKKTKKPLLYFFKKNQDQYMIKDYIIIRTYQFNAPQDHIYDQLLEFYKKYGSPSGEELKYNESE